MKHAPNAHREEYAGAAGRVEWVFPRTSTRRPGWQYHPACGSAERQAPVRVS